MRRSAIVLIVTSLLALTSVRADAADREHQQIMAEIRMLQEQSQQLQLALSTLSDALKGLNTKIETQSETARRNAADQKLLVDNVADDVRVVREKVDDSAVRLNSLSQEVDALRQSVAARATAPPSQQGLTPIPITSPEGETPNPETDPAAPPYPETPTEPETTPDPETTETPSSETTPDTPITIEPAEETAEEPASTAIPPGASPSRMFDSAFADYASGQWTLAIAGFDSFLRTFPKSDLADNAQFLIGEAYSMDEKLTEAVDSYDKVIADYPDGDKVPDSLYKKGLALSLLDEPDRARDAFETVIEEHPESEAATLARQVLDGMNRRARQ
ncbi:MAG: tol-pal system protein YbgF [Luteitalea sp.]|nr:tol-pal system protein YbgF [Luteitalea sp.]